MKERIPAVVALGMFDGVHLGHRALLERAVKEASRLNAKPVVFTFSNHPMEVLGGGVRLLSGISERDRILGALGAKEVASVPFTRELAMLGTEAFVDLLLERWDVRALVVGYNYTCGARGNGTPETLAEIGKTRGFSVFVVPPVLLEGAPISSTRPACITPTRSAKLRTKGRSWVISSTAMPNSACSSSRSSTICFWMVTSSAVVGSSAISSFGLQASAIAIIARCRCPPDN